MSSSLNIKSSSKALAAFSYVHPLVGILALIFKRKSGFVRQHAIASLIIFAILSSPSLIAPLIFPSYFATTSDYDFLLPQLIFLRSVTSLPLPYSILMLLAVTTDVLCFIFAIYGRNWPLIPFKPSEADYIEISNKENLNQNSLPFSYIAVNIYLVILSLLFFSPLFFFFLIKFIDYDSPPGLISAFLFIAFIVVLIFKLLIQTYYLHKISRLIPNLEIQSSPELSQAFGRLGKSHVSSAVKTAILLSGLIPFLQLLTIWIAIPAGLMLELEYAEFQFFKDINLYLKSRINQRTSLNLGLLKTAKISFNIATPLLPVALFFGLKALLNF